MKYKYLNVYFYATEINTRLYLLTQIKCSVNWNDIAVVIIILLVYFVNFLASSKLTCSAYEYALTHIYLINVKVKKNTIKYLCNNINVYHSDLFNLFVYFKLKLSLQV